MSDLLERLYAQGAVNPALSHPELAAAHIPFGDLGVRPAPEQLLLDAVGQTDGITLVVGPSGSGKSSLITYIAERLIERRRDDRRYLPLLVPVAAQTAGAVGLPTFGRSAIANLLSALPIPEEGRNRLDHLAAEQLTQQLPTRDFNARLALNVGAPGAPIGAGAEFGARLHDQVTQITAPGAIDHDRYGGLEELAHVLRGLQRELVILIEDTDAWAIRAEDGGREIAAAFFGGVLAPLQAPGFAVVVAAQTHWTELEAFAAIAERAVARVDIPAYGRGQARGVLETIIAGRMNWALDDGGDHSAGEILEDDALDMLAAQLARTGSVRRPLSLLRDAMGRVSASFPASITLEQLLESV